jgi:hypothetical protein
VGHEIPGGPPAFGFLVVGLVPEYPRVISPSPVMQVFAAHVAIARERRKHSHGKCREFPPNLAGEPRPRAALAGRPASDPPTTEYRLAGRPAGGLDDEHDSTPRDEAYGAKKAKSGGVSLRLRRVRSALTHVKARMGPTLTKG